VRIDTLFISHVELARQAIIAYQVAAVEPYRQRIAAERLVPCCCWALRVNMEMGFVAVPGIADKTNERSSVHQLLRAQQWVSSQPHRRTNWLVSTPAPFPVRPQIPHTSQTAPRQFAEHLVARTEMGDVPPTSGMEVAFRAASASRLRSQMLPELSRTERAPAHWNPACRFIRVTRF
jgi:hypothetical protein